MRLLALVVALAALCATGAAHAAEADGDLATVSDPENREGTVAVTIDGKSLRVDLPTGDRAGASVTIAMPGR